MNTWKEQYAHPYKGYIPQRDIIKLQNVLVPFQLISNQNQTMKYYVWS